MLAMEHGWNIPDWFSETWLESLSQQSIRFDLAHTQPQLRFARQWSTGWRNLPSWMVYAIRQGEATVEVRESGGVQKAPVAAGTLIVVPAHTPFCLTGVMFPLTASRFRFYIDEEPQRDRPAFIGQGDAAADVLLRETIAEIAQKDGFAHRLQARSLLVALFVSVGRRHIRVTHQKRVLTPVQQQQIHLWCAQWLSEQPNQAACADDVAELLGLSSDYCTRLFRATFGVAPRGWLLAQRLQHIAGLLEESSETIASIAARFGYANPALLSSQFSKQFGCSPRVYRQQARG